MLLVTYDDAGGTYDHIVPPSVGVPNDGSPCNLGALRNANKTSHCNLGEPFDFRRLGLRAAAMLISPWVAKGAVFQEPRTKYPTSQFEHSSIAATAKRLFNLTGYLTNRDAWAGEMDELLSDELRDDSPLHLPEAPQPAHPFPPPPPIDAGRVAGEGAQRRQLAAAGGGPRHCSLRENVHAQRLEDDRPMLCHGQTAVTPKQRARVELLSLLTFTPTPDVDALDSAAADQWIAARWADYMALGDGVEQGSSPSATTLRTPHLSLELDTHGVVSRLTEVATGRSLLAPGMNQSLLTLVYGDTDKGAVDPVAPAVFLPSAAHNELRATWASGVQIVLQWAVEGDFLTVRVKDAALLPTAGAPTRTRLLSLRFLNIPVHMKRAAGGPAAVFDEDFAIFAAPSDYRVTTSLGNTLASLSSPSRGAQSCSAVGGVMLTASMGGPGDVGRKEPPPPLLLLELVGRGATLWGGPRGTLDAAIQQAEKMNGLPSPLIDGKWAKHNARGGYFFISM